jgi:hypothetical protein
MNHLTTLEIEARMDDVLASPSEVGTVELIVRRPDEDLREELEIGELDVERGLVGDCWRPSDGEGCQITLMNSRFAAMIAQDDSRRALAGDQLFVDLDLSEPNVPAGTRLAVGDAMLEVTSEPHNGCRKFVERFGRDAMVFANSEIGKRHHLRGIYARVVVSGKVRRGDEVRKLG